MQERQIGDWVVRKDRKESKAWGTTQANGWMWGDAPVQIKSFVDNGDIPKHWFTVVGDPCEYNWFTHSVEKAFPDVSKQPETPSTSPSAAIKAIKVGDHTFDSLESLLEAVEQGKFSLIRNKKKVKKEVKVWVHKNCKEVVGRGNNLQVYCDDPNNYMYIPALITYEVEEDA